MEENLSQKNSQAVKPEFKTVPTVSKTPTVPTATPTQTTGKGWKLAILMSIFVLAGSIAYSVYQFSQKPTAPTVVSQPTPTPVPVVQPTPTPDPTSSWKTYTNTKHGYSIKCPQDWVLAQGPEIQPEEVLVNKDKVSFSGPETGFDININPIVANDKQLQCSTDNECLQKWMEFLKEDPNKVSYSFKTILGKTRKGFELNNTGQEFYPQYFVFLEKGKIWNVGIPSAKYKSGKFVKLYDQILSTFKFLE